MLLYLVGTQVFKDGKPMNDPYIIGFSHDPTLADRYYETLVAKAEKEPDGGDGYSQIYFIKKMSESKFKEFMNNPDVNTCADEIFDYGHGAVMTDADNEYLSEAVMEMVSEINNAMGTHEVVCTKLESMIKVGKFIRPKRIRRKIEAFRKLYNELADYFDDFQNVYDDIDWAKVHRKL